MSQPIPWAPVWIESPTLDDIRRALPDYRRMTLQVLDAILQRSERDPDDPFIDTKFSTITGEDFVAGEQGETLFKSRETVYAWIQGRALEALIGHAHWLQSCTEISADIRHDRVERIGRLAAQLAAALESVRERNNGRLFFTFLGDGTPIRFGKDGKPRPCEIPLESNFSELFVAKGLLAAGDFFRRLDWLESGQSLLLRICRDIESGHFRGDQIPYPPVEKPILTSLQCQAPWMIALGAHALAYRVSADPQWLERGLRYLDTIMDNHLNLSQFAGLQLLDLVENLDTSGRPLDENGMILSSIGHVMEVVGLGTQVLLLLQKSKELAPARRERAIRRYQELLPRVLLHHFDLGFNPEAGGICLTVDLLTRKPVNTHLPWWILPETLRAAAEVLVFSPDQPEYQQILQLLQHCSNAFLHRFVNPKVSLFAYQTRNNQGDPIDWIPATPDADPGYHTGLSVIDFLRCLTP